MMADFPCHAPFTNVTNKPKNYQCDHHNNDSINLPSWIVKNQKFLYQPGYAKVKRGNDKKDIGNYEVCLQNIIETLCDYGNESYGLF